jgi:hypothetical protein
MLHLIGRVFGFVDVTKFKHLKSKYITRNGKVYWLISSGHFGDKVREVTGVRLEDFRIDRYAGYATNSEGHVFFQGKRMRDVDAESFHVIGHGYASDKDRTYFCGEISDVKFTFGALLPYEPLGKPGKINLDAIPKSGEKYPFPENFFLKEKVSIATH